MPEVKNPSRLATKVFIETSPLTARHMSGVGHVLLHLLRTWQKSPEIAVGYEPILLVPYDKREHIDSYNFGFAVKSLPISDKMLRAMRKFNLLPPMDLVLGKGVYVFPNYWNWRVLQPNSKSITFIYDVAFKTHPEFVEPRNRQFLASHMEEWMKRADAIVVDSNFVHSELSGLYEEQKHKIITMHLGVSQHQSNMRAEIPKITNKYGIKGEYLLFVSNIEPRKNISRLLEAYQKLPVELRDKYSLVLVGADGWNNEKIKSDILTAQKAGYRIIKVEHFVSDEELPILYAGATALVHPALYEGFGMTPLEAMACGTPVVVARNSSIPEVVGDAGLYFNARDAADISDKIRILLEDADLRKKMRSLGLSRSKQFTWESSLAELIKCVGSLDR